MPYIDNAFCWHGIVTTRSEPALAFYPEVLGWTVQQVPMGDAVMPTFLAGESGRAHLEVDPAATPHWNHYLRVDDVDARTAAAVAHGGAVVVPPNDIPPGRFSVVTSPSGAALHLFHEADGSVQPGSAQHGAIHWVELWSTAVDDDLAWLSNAFGYTIETMQMPNGPYHLLTHDGAQRGGAMASEDGAQWLAWVRVDDVDAAVGRTTQHGGTTLTEPFDVPHVGRMAVVADPDGARFGVITPTP